MEDTGTKNFPFNEKNYFFPAFTNYITAAILYVGAGISLIYNDNFNDLLGGFTRLAGFLVLLVINCTLFAIDKWVTKENIFTSPVTL